jgi:hypothetical protein
MTQMKKTIFLKYIIVFVFIRSEFEPTIYHTRDEHTNHGITENIRITIQYTMYTPNNNIFEKEEHLNFIF